MHLGASPLPRQALENEAIGCEAQRKKKGAFENVEMRSLVALRQPTDSRFVEDDLPTGCQAASCCGGDSRDA